jgi:hypothetical protein
MFILAKPKLIPYKFFRLLEIGYYLSTSCVDVLLLLAKVGGFDLLFYLGFQQDHLIYG